ncbi:hypothetical protein BKA80DRAFT_281028, partial [Phyllosticta citrichinensis]
MGEFLLRLGPWLLGLWCLSHARRMLNLPACLPASRLKKLTRGRSELPCSRPRDAPTTYVPKYRYLMSLATSRTQAHRLQHTSLSLPTHPKKSRFHKNTIAKRC